MITHIQFNLIRNPNVFQLLTFFTDVQQTLFR